jgi:hypothetical protein
MDNSRGINDTSKVISMTVISDAPSCSIILIQLVFPGLPFSVTSAQIFESELAFKLFIMARKDSRDTMNCHN